MKKIMLITVLFTTTLLSCNKEDQFIADKTDLCDFEQFSTFLKNDLNQIGTLIRDANTDFSNSKAVLESAESYYCKSSTDFVKFSLAFNDQSNKGSEYDHLTPYQKLIVEEVEYEIANSTDYIETLSFLDNKLKEISSSVNITNETNSVLLYISSVKASMEFFDENQDLFPDFADTKGKPWWEKWGRCAASIAGGAITGAGTGILGGAAVGTVVLPIVGTVSGAVLGGVILGIGGGFTGAAAGC